MSAFVVHTLNGPKFSDPVHETRGLQHEIIPVRWIDKVLELALERMPEQLPEPTMTPSVAVVAEDPAATGVVTH